MGVGFYPFVLLVYSLTVVTAILPACPEGEFLVSDWPQVQSTFCTSDCCPTGSVSTAPCVARPVTMGAFGQTGGGGGSVGYTPGQTYEANCLSHSADDTIVTGGCYVKSDTVVSLTGGYYTFTLTVDVVVPGFLDWYIVVYNTTSQLKSGLTTTQLLLVGIATVRVGTIWIPASTTEIDFMLMPVAQTTLRISGYPDYFNILQNTTLYVSTSNCTADPSPSSGFSTVYVGFEIGISLSVLLLLGGIRFCVYRILLAKRQNANPMPPTNSHLPRQSILCSTALIYFKATISLLGQVILWTGAWDILIPEQVGGVT